MSIGKKTSPSINIGNFLKKKNQYWKDKQTQLVVQSINRLYQSS